MIKVGNLGVLVRRLRVLFIKSRGFAMFVELGGKSLVRTILNAIFYYDIRIDYLDCDCTACLPYRILLADIPWHDGMKAAMGVTPSPCPCMGHGDYLHFTNQLTNSLPMLVSRNLRNEKLGL
jgi:hypothetical protein